MYLNILSDILFSHWVEALMVATVVMVAILLERMMSGKSIRKLSLSQYFFGFVMLCYLYLLGVATGLFVKFDISLDLFRLRSINLIPLSGFTVEQCVMNILLFLPLGFLAPLIFRTLGKRDWVKILILSLSTSLMVEVLQLLHETRAFDINDLMFNTLGGLLGYGVYLVVKSLLNRL
jgi:glycopeptide antibiotics resistance protein